MPHRVRIILTLLSLAGGIGVIPLRAEPQIDIPRIEQMPNLPTPYHMRDWRRVAEDFDALAFDAKKRGDHLPLIKRVEGPGIEGREVFGLDTYVGWINGMYEAITCLGAVNGASVAGIDKSNQNGENWVALCANFFRDQPELQMVLNSPNDDTGESFWYELFPNILFYRIYDRYPGTPGMDLQFIAIADQWIKACEGMGGRTDPWEIPDFNHTSYDFKTQHPYDNGIWKEPASSAGIAWLEYMAFIKTGEVKYLSAAKWGLDFLQQASKNPYYEGLFPHAPYLAARMNAEQGTDYDLEKFMNWCMDGSNRRQWGETVGRAGGYDVSGLVGSLWSNPEGSYAFAMNTFNKANSLVPMVRYDDRFARAVGKWMLNAANSMRLLYPNGLPADHQTDADWSTKYDPTSCIAYEALRREETIITRLEADHETPLGRLKSGTVKETWYTNKRYQVLEEVQVAEGDRLKHIWRTSLPEGHTHKLTMVGQVSGREGFSISYASTPEGPYTPIFKFDKNTQQVKNVSLSGGIETLYLQVEDAGERVKGESLDSFSLDDVWIISKTDKQPFATGDAKGDKWAKTNLGLYGSAFAGIFGGIIRTTNVERILQLNCLATDYFSDSAYPTYLYFNPYEDERTVEIQTGEKEVDLYDAVSGTFLKRNVLGAGAFTIPGDCAVLLVQLPGGTELEQRGAQRVLKGIVVDYRSPSPQ